MKYVEKDFDIAKLLYFDNSFIDINTYHHYSIFKVFLLWPYISFQLIYSSHPKRNFDWKCPWRIDSVSGLHFNQVMAWRWIKTHLWKHFLTLLYVNLLHCIYMTTSIIMQQNHWSHFIAQKIFCLFLFRSSFKSFVFYEACSWYPTVGWWHDQ